MTALELGTLDDPHLSWQVAHEALSRLARARAAADAEEGRWLLAAERAAVHVHLGYGSFNEYVERLFGYQRRSTQERLRVAEALEGLPILARALAAGELSWSAARELTRVAVRDTEQEWLEFARGKTLRQLEQVLAQHRSGDTPASPPGLAAQRHTLRFEVMAETLASFREALSELRRRAGTPLDDDSALLELARCVLGGPSHEGRASYQVVLHVCPDCGNGQQQAAGALVPVDPHVVEMAQCDAQRIGPIPARAADPSSAPANDLGLDEDRNGHERTSDAATANPNGAPVGVARVLPRATQSIPPAVRRAVLLRDQHRCQVPGCHNSRWLDVHHIQLRSEGGRHLLPNLVCLCGAHHRAVHHGALELERRESGAIRVRHADGTQYGCGVQPQVVELRAKVFSALRQLGFREAEVRVALQQLQGEPPVGQASFDGLLRAALARLRSARGQR